MPKRERPAPRGWEAAPEFTPESRQITASFPDLHLRVWCNIKGINVLAYVDRSDSTGRIHRTSIASATWRGRPPSEVDVALWGALVLSTWLESRVLAAGEEELAGA